MLDIFHSDLKRARLRDGARITADIVGATLGPCGSPIVVGDPRTPLRIARTGHAAATSVHFVDRAETAGALLLQQVGRWTADAAGDGTASAIAVAGVLIREIVNSTLPGFRPDALSAGIEDAICEVQRHLDDLIRPADTADVLRDVASTAAGCRRVGNLVVDAALPGPGGWMALIRPDHAGEVAWIGAAPGMIIAAGYAAPQLVTQRGRRRSRLRVEGPLVLVAERNFEQVDELASVLAHAARARRPLVVFARAFSKGFASALVRREDEGAPQVIPVGVSSDPQGISLFADLARATDASIVRAQSRALATAADLGEARAILIDERRTLVAGFASQTAFGEPGLQQVYVGGNSRDAASDHLVRAERAAIAIHGASLHGVLPGGGVALLSAARALSVLGITQRMVERRLAFSIVQRALEEPFRQIVQNAGISSRRALEEVRRRDAEDCPGITLPSGAVVDVRAAGILDSSIMVRAIVHSAGLCARLLLAGEQVAACQHARAAAGDERVMASRRTLQ